MPGSGMKAQTNIAESRTISIRAASTDAPKAWNQPANMAVNRGGWSHHTSV